ncbi:phosphodiesterase [Halomonas sp. ISL-60]|uniref:phosphodiesterase n=1 Tax=unclassified Halomonas TaxID=2609666 RepID=UPI0007DA423F|nr:MULTISPECIES: phosphodiesterase [unclassified Halomonas]MBT2772842.1 phosphodiesterase [Halomonas sp. ISL-60]MBT2787396.1 phosphodiesterase [Halomonas sp. ISL-106]MBT2796242.1 phosphodiesterase [Halomonas sp. ISL-104]MBT2802418.1 phosphodiesterase [Halomonas sp. ISL-56]OAL57606.1 metallophosphoesterase [Halomonas sp. ALS9]
MRVVQITDAHLYADTQARSRAGIPWRQFQQVLSAVVAARPDIVLFTGDVSQDGSAASYALAVQAMEQLPCPWYWLPGNHDQLELMAAERPMVDQVDMGAWRILLLNTQVEGKPYGELGSERLAKLAEQLEQDGRPTLIAMHHPPVDVGAVWMDAIGLQDRDAFWQLLSQCPQVKIVLFGHVHQAYAEHHSLGEGLGEGAGEPTIDVYGCPAMADQFLPAAEQFAVDEASRPGYRIVDLTGSDAQQGEWQSWIERIE